MRILAIETSCDETAIALVQCSGGLSAPKFKILKDAVASQIKVHRPFGGVVPNLAKREHIKNLPMLWKKLRVTSDELREIDLIAVTSGPGLEPALWAGIGFAKEVFAKRKEQMANRKAQLVGANHLEGHLYSFLLAEKKGVKYQVSSIKKLFPAIGIIASGGHTTLMLLKDLKTRKKLGETRDDAVGEAFDKVARILGLPYPGGPEIEKIARNGNPNAIPFPRPMVYDKNYDFSYSGLKTAVLYYVRDKFSSTNNESKTNKRIRKFEKNSLFADVAASFQEAALDVLVRKAMRAADEFGARSLLLSGGVAANKPLRQKLAREAKKTGRKFLVAEFKHNTDNAVMIAVAAYINYLKGKKLAPHQRASFGAGYPLIANGAMNIK